MSAKDRFEEYNRKIKKGGRLPPDLRMEDHEKKESLLSPIFRALESNRREYLSLGLGPAHLVTGTVDWEPHIQMYISQPLFSNASGIIKIYVSEKKGFFSVKLIATDSGKRKTLLEYKKRPSGIEEALFAIRAAVPKGWGA